MKLYDAIKKIIVCDGEKAITDLKIINILSDFQAFKDMPSSKYVLHASIRDGYVKRLLTIGSWNIDTQKLLDKFIFDTGFQHDVAYYVFQSIAYGLGYITSISNSPQPTSNTNPNNMNVKSGKTDLTLTSVQLNKKSATYLLNYCEAANEYLDSIIEISEDILKTKGININVFCKYKVFSNPSATITFNIEVKGDIKMKKENFSLHCFDIIVYNNAGRILDKVDVYMYNTIKNYGVITSEGLDEPSFKTVGNISRVVIVPVEL